MQHASRALQALVLVCLVTAASRADTVEVDLTGEINLAHNNLAKPLSLAPDVWLRATDALTVGLTHSHASLDRFEPGGSLCLTDDLIYCDSTYRGSTVDARYALHAGRLDVSPRVRAVLADVAPVKTAMTFGALLRWHRGRIALAGDPYVYAALAGTSKGNRSALFIPLELDVRISRVTLALHSGWNSTFKNIRDDWHIPVAVGARVAATRDLDVGATLGFATLLGPQNTPKERVLFVTAAVRR